ncbi:MAG: hypothetical protein IKV68_03240 [Oscillospiraceae bacterium]|nr:hypothetical protein [Oscillospiraceae bacterium]
MKKCISRRITPDIAIFLAAVLFSAVVTWFVTGSCIDSDASSELILAQHLAQTGRLLSRGWLYSTELRVVNTQLIYAPLFLLLDNWHTVRYVGALLLQGILVGAFCFYGRSIGLARRVVLCSAALLLLPLSVCYGRIVLYNCYYVPHIALSLVMTALIFGDSSSARRRNVRLLCLLLVSFAGGLGGVRQLMMTHAPVLLAILLRFLLEDFLIRQNDSVHERQRLGVLGRAIASTALFFGGFLVNKLCLAPQYTFSDYSSTTLRLLDPGLWDDVLYGYLHHFGLRDEITLLSPLGALSVLGAGLGVLAVVLALAGTVRGVREQQLCRSLPQLMFLSFLTVTLGIFFFAGDDYYFVLYLSPIVVWAVPLFVSWALDGFKSGSWLNLRRLLPLAAAAILLCNGIVNSVYLLSGEHFTQKYEGLVFQNREHRAQLENAVSFLQAQRYEVGYATFWNSNILTEMTDGAIRTVNITLDEESGEIAYHNWLTLLPNRNTDGKKVFLLLENRQCAAAERSGVLDGCRIVYQDALFAVYAPAQP